MSSQVKKVTNFSNFKLTPKDLQNEQELSRLQRDLRHKASGVSSSFLKEQKWLDREMKYGLEEQIQLDNSLPKQHALTYEEHLKYLENHLKCQQDLDEEIALNKIYINQIQSQLRRLDKLELDLKRNSISDLQHKTKMEKMHKNYEVYDQRLFISKQKEGKLIAENRELSKAIRLMVYQREVFLKHWELLVQELGQNKRYLIDLIERSIVAFTIDEDWHAKINELETRSSMTKKAHVSEIFRLFTKLDSQQIYHFYLEMKGFRREMSPLDEREVRRREFVEESLKNKLNEFWKIIDKIQQKYWSNIDEIPSSTQNKLLILYTIIDQVNTDKTKYFAHFHYLNDIYNTIELLNTQITDKHEQITQARDNQEKNITKYTTNHLKLYKALQQAKQDTLHKQQEMNTRETQLTNHLKAVHQMFQTLQCDTTFINSLLGHKKTVTNFNIKLFLTSLEKSLNKILAYIYFAESSAKIPSNQQTIKTKRLMKDLIFIPNTVNTTQCSECAERADVNRYDETIVLPMSQVNVKEKLRQRVEANELEYRLHNLSKCRLPRSKGADNLLM